MRRYQDDRITCQYSSPSALTSKAWVWFELPRTKSISELFFTVFPQTVSSHVRAGGKEGGREESKPECPPARPRRPQCRRSPRPRPAPYCSASRMPAVPHQQRAQRKGRGGGVSHVQASTQFAVAAQLHKHLFVERQPDQIQRLRDGVCDVVVCHFCLVGSLGRGLVGWIAGPSVAGWIIGGPKSSPGNRFTPQFACQMR